MPFYDDAARDFLAQSICRPDPGESAFWRQQHETFSYTNGRLSGLRGFGYLRPATAQHALINRLLHFPFRRLGGAAFKALDRHAAELCRLQDRSYELDVLRQALTLDFLQAKIPDALSPGKTLAVIGDGFATLSSLALLAYPGLQVVMVNLTKTLLVDYLYLKRVHPNKRAALVTSHEALKKADAEVLMIQAGDAELLADIQIDLAVNIASFQEMNPPIIAKYFDVLRKSQPLFYCCNREEKILPDGTAVRFADYPWSPKDDVAIDELCPWHQGYYSLWPPFYRPYHGPHRHRLAKLSR